MIRKLYFYVSTCDTDKLSTISVFAKNERIAYKLVCKNFDEHNYKGYPKKLAI